MELVFKKAGVKTRKIKKIKLTDFLAEVIEIELDSGYFYIKRKTGEREIIWHESYYETLCKMLETSPEDILEYTPPARKEILDKVKFYKKEYMTSASSELLLRFLREQDNSINIIYP